jgi:hypothetical protein
MYINIDRQHINFLPPSFTFGQAVMICSQRRGVIVGMSFVGKWLYEICQIEPLCLHKDIPEERLKLKADDTVILLKRSPSRPKLQSTSRSATAVNTRFQA